MALICVSLDVVLNRFLIPAMGVRGAAVATTAAVGAGCAMALYWVWKTYHRLMNASSVYRFAVSGAGMCAALILLPRTGISFIATSILGSVLYGALLFATGELHLQEFYGIFGKRPDRPGRG